MNTMTLLDLGKYLLFVQFLLFWVLPLLVVLAAISYVRYLTARKNREALRRSNRLILYAIVDLIILILVTIMHVKLFG